MCVCTYVCFFLGGGGGGGGWGGEIFYKLPTKWVVSRFLPTKTPPRVIAPTASNTRQNIFSVLLRWSLFWSRRTPLRKLYFLAYQSFLLIFLSFSSVILNALLIKEAILSQLSGDLSMNAILLSFDNGEPTCAASFILTWSCTGHTNIKCYPSSSSSPHNRQLLLSLLCPFVARYTPKHQCTEARMVERSHCVARARMGCTANS